MTTAFRNFKRIIAVLAIICLMFSLMPANTFAFQATDISGHWAQVKIQSWIDKGLIKGYPDGTFKPDQDITRAEFMTLANRAFGYTAVAPITYTDVKAGSWYAPEVAKAQAAGYITGYPDGTMKPENPISREEVATIISRIKGLNSDVNAADKYTDAAKIGSWSKGQVGAVTSAKIMQGYPDGSFMPQGLITRAEVVVALDNALHYTAPVVVTPPVVTPPVVTPPVVTPPVVTPPVVTYPVTTYYPVTFTVEDATYAPVQANIAIASQTIATDVYGEVTINLANGIYPYAVTALGFNDITGSSVTVAGAAVAVPVTMTAITNTNVTSPAFATTNLNNTVTVTLTGGTFAAGPFTAADFTFAGTDATAIAAGTFTRTSDTVVTITGLTLAGGTDNTVTVLAATQTTQATSVAGEASTVALPDLTVDTLYFDPAQPIAGGSVTFYFTVHNQGSAPVPAGYLVYVYIDGTYSDQGTDPDGIASGASADWYWDTTWPIDTASHTFMVVLDPNGVIAESNESNNSASISASAAPTDTPVITTPVYASDTSVSGTAEADASVVLTLNGTPETAVTATGGAWTVSGLILTTDDAISVTALTSGKTISAAATTTVLADLLQTATPGIHVPVYASDTSVSGAVPTAEAGASVVLTLNGTPETAVTATGGAWTVSGLILTTDDAISVTALTSGKTISAAATTTVLADLLPTDTPVITTPVYASDTSVSGTAEAGASVVLTLNGTPETAVTATGGAWTVSGLILTTDDAISVTALTSGKTISAAATTTVLVSP